MSRWLLLASLLFVTGNASYATPAPAHADALVSAADVAAAKKALVAKYPASKAAIERGVDQVAKLWRTSDGNIAEFCSAQFVADAPGRDALFARLESMMEHIDG